jgi:hypothetical protein
MLMGLVINAQEETVVPNNFYCPNCYGTDGSWYLNYPWFSQYAYRITKSEKKLVWGTMSALIRNQPHEGATNITRGVESTVSISWSSTDSSSLTSEVKAQLSIQRTGSIGGSFTAQDSWSETTSGSSSIVISTGRVCQPGYAIWERGYYYEKEILVTEYQYNDGLSARYWCPIVCNAYTKTDTFTDIYAESEITVVYPSGEAGIWASTGPYNTDVFHESYYNGLTSLYNDIDLLPKSFQSQKGGVNW